jgi:predicted nucleic acid-binding Zn ribbon protein
MIEKKNFKETLSKVIEDINKKVYNKNEIISKLWNKNTDKEIETHTQIVTIKDKTLFIKADSPAWIYEVKSKKNKIIENINREAKKEILKDIKVKLGDL